MFATDEAQPFSALVETVNVALVAPAATVTLAGTMATAVSLLARVTTAPPVGAAALKVTVPVELFPAVTLTGLRLNRERVVIGVTVSAADLPLPP